MIQKNNTRHDSARDSLLVPMDFSECSRSALIYASRLVEGTSTSLLLLHVIHDDVSKPGLYSNTDNYRMARPIKDVADEMLESMLTGYRNQNPELLSLQAASTLFQRNHRLWQKQLHERVTPMLSQLITSCNHDRIIGWRKWQFINNNQR